MRRVLYPCVVVVAILALTGCGRLTRIAMINQTAQTSGVSTASAIQQQLVKQGYANPRVSCAKTMIVNVGTQTTCEVAGVGTNKTVRFTFSRSNGAVDPGSVRLS
jgi:hypothetical protein